MREERKDKKVMTKKIIHIYTDGACDNIDTKQGSWAFVMLNSKETRIVAEKSGAKEATTNNRMEMRAAMESIKHFLFMCLEKSLEPSDFTLVIHSDSQYVVKGISEWIIKWEKKGYKGVKNDLLWKEFLNLKKAAGDVTFKWVKAHVGNRWNEYADSMCSKLCKNANSHLKYIRR